MNYIPLTYLKIHYNIVTAKSQGHAKTQHIHTQHCHAAYTYTFSTIKSHLNAVKANTLEYNYW